MTTIELKGDRQSGNTTMAIGMLRELHEQGVPVVYVAPTPDMAREIKKRRNLPFACIAAYDVLRGDTPYSLSVARAIALDNMTLFPNELDVHRICAAFLERHPGPTQLILID